MNCRVRWLQVGAIKRLSAYERFKVLASRVFSCSLRMASSRTTTSATCHRKDMETRSCDHTFSLGKCMLSHPSFSWGMFENIFGPQKNDNDQATQSEVNSHCSFAHFNQRLFSLKAIVLRRAIVLTSNFSVDFLEELVDLHFGWVEIEHFSRTMVLPKSTCVQKWTNSKPAVSV